MSTARHGSNHTTHYDVLGVASSCDTQELRAAYRRLAWAAHPDVSATATEQSKTRQQSMADINEAWRVLSDPDSRRSYDATLVPQCGPATEPFGYTVPPRAPAASSPVGQRRQAWVAGIRAQMGRLASQAGRSATQTLLLRNPRAARVDYDIVVDGLVRRLTADTESRVRAARAAGAAPLDLGVAATLVGVRSVADQVRRQGSVRVTRELLMQAELLDRMWDVMAHELPAPLAVALGGNPRTAKALQAKP